MRQRQRQAAPFSNRAARTFAGDGVLLERIPHALRQLQARQPLLRQGQAVGGGAGGGWGMAGETLAVTDAARGQLWHSKPAAGAAAEALPLACTSPTVHPVAGPVGAPMDAVWGGCCAQIRG